MTLSISITEPDDRKPLRDAFSAGRGAKYRIMVIVSLVLMFTLPVLIVLAIDLPAVIKYDGDTPLSGVTKRALRTDGQRGEVLSPITADKLVNSRELSLNTNFVVSSTPTVREYDFHISQAYAAPDGFRKLMILVNGQSPGPLIEANAGDTVRVLVHNELRNESTSIHWHGIDQKNTTWMDGVTGVTQCGIPPGENFTYEFQIIDQRGTFWYHGHTTTQYTDGLFGPIVNSPSPLSLIHLPLTPTR